MTSRSGCPKRRRRPCGRCPVRVRREGAHLKPYSAWRPRHHAGAMAHLCLPARDQRVRETPGTPSRLPAGIRISGRRPGSSNLGRTRMEVTLRDAQGDAHAHIPKGMCAPCALVHPRTMYANVRCAPEMCAYKTGPIFDRWRSEVLNARAAVAVVFMAARHHCAAVSSPQIGKGLHLSPKWVRRWVQGRPRDARYCCDTEVCAIARDRR
jgi:hypothetical protein